MKLSEYAKQQGVRYETAWRWFRDGKIKGRRVGKHTILIEEDQEQVPPSKKVAVYAYESSRIFREPVKPLFAGVARGCAP